MTLGCLLRHQDMVIQVSAPIAAAVLVTTNALVARPPEERALPALKPNHPNQSSDAPSTTIVVSWGSIFSSPKPMRRPRTRAQTMAETPELMWTTVPPAKSSAPN